MCVILGEKYENYEDGLLRTNLESPKEGREKLCKTFAIKYIKSENPRINNIDKWYKYKYNIFSKKKTKYGMGPTAPSSRLCVQNVRSH